MRRQGVAGWARRAVRRLSGTGTRKALILLYHSVNDWSLDPQLLGVTPEHFAEHLDVIRRRYNPMRLQGLVHALQDGDVPPRTVVMTFDDGYADNLDHAKPHLERSGIPSTVFVTTGYLESGREFWWDELERIVLQPGTVPGQLQLRVNGRTCQWGLDDAATYSEQAARRHEAWNVLAREDPSPRQRLYRDLCHLLRPLSDDERQRVLAALRSWAGVPSACRRTHRPLSEEEVRRLSGGGLIEVGAHTVAHQALAMLPTSAQQSEIQHSKAHLEQVLGGPVTSFAYPYGTRSDYTAETVGIVREAGFTCACSNVDGLVWPRSDLFQLPRMLVRDWDGETLTRFLREWGYG